jgi:hypothetical protein
MTNRLATSDFVFNALNQAKQYEELASLYEIRVSNDPTIAQQWASLAFCVLPIGTSRFDD